MVEQIITQSNSRANSRISRRIFKGFVKVALYLLFVGLAIYFTPKILSQTLNTPYPLATITSGSMWPALKVDDLILMRGLSGNDVEVGQIIVFQNAQQGFTIHRLIKKENNKLVTKGDANEVEDSPIKPEDVIGRVLYIGSHPVRIPYLGIVARTFGPSIQKFESSQ